LFFATDVEQKLSFLARMSAFFRTGAAVLYSFKELRAE